MAASIHLFRGASTPKKDFANPPLVSALCPEGSGETVQLMISPSTIKKFIDARRSTEMFQAWAHLVGEMPPINNAELVRRTDHPDATISAVRDAHACFKGVKRRYDQDDDGKEIYVYVIATGHTVRWRADMRTTAGIYAVPEGTLLTVQAKPRASLQDCPEGIWGAIVKWEFVNADRERTEFPEGFDARYDMLVWPR